MSIEKKEGFVVVCDECGEMLDETGETGGRLYETYADAENRAAIFGWVIKTSCICEYCIENQPANKEKTGNSLQQTK